MGDKKIIVTTGAEHTITGTNEERALLGTPDFLSALLPGMPQQDLSTFMRAMPQHADPDWHAPLTEPTYVAVPAHVEEDDEDGWIWDINIDYIICKETEHYYGEPTEAESDEYLNKALKSINKHIDLFKTDNPPTSLPDVAHIIGVTATKRRQSDPRTPHPAAELAKAGKGGLTPEQADYYLGFKRDKKPVPDVGKKEGGEKENLNIAKDNFNNTFNEKERIKVAGDAVGSGAAILVDSFGLPLPAQDDVRAVPQGGAVDGDEIDLHTEGNADAAISLALEVAEKMKKTGKIAEGLSDAKSVITLSADALKLRKTKEDLDIAKKSGNQQAIKDAQKEFDNAYDELINDVAMETLSKAAPELATAIEISDLLSTYFDNDLGFLYEERADLLKRIHDFGQSPISNRSLDLNALNHKLDEVDKHIRKRLRTPENSRKEQEVMKQY